MKNLLFFIILSLPWSDLQANTGRTMYVDNFKNILGDITAENNLLNFAQARDIETLLLYDLHIVHASHDLSDPTSNFILANFIYKAKTTFGITHIGATAENGDFFTNVIDAYNNSRSEALEKFDIYNLEFEYWQNASTGPSGYYCTTYLTPNGLPCSVDGAFEYFMSTLQTINDLADNNATPITTEAYVGWPTAGQADTIGANLDRLRLHAYVEDPSTAFNYAKDRVIDFANGTPNLAVSIIFSSETDFMKDWLENHSIKAAENIFTTSWLNESSGWAENINLQGFTYFTYSELLNVNLPVATAKTPINKIAKVYPIPAQDLLYLESIEPIKELMIYDAYGQAIKVFNKIAPSASIQLDVQALLPGLYFLTIKSDSKLETLKFEKTP